MFDFDDSNTHKEEEILDEAYGEILETTFSKSFQMFLPLRCAHSKV